MPHRGNSKPSNRLSWQKSSSSLHTRKDSSAPDVARRDAYAAAKYAFARAQERNSADVGRSLARIDSTISHHDYRHQDLPQFHASEQGERAVKRQQSVRFSGPTAVRRHQSIGMRAVSNTMETQANSAAHRPRALTNNDAVPASYRPPSRSSSIGKASVGKGTAENFVAALAAYDEYYTLEDDMASTPSSYRRVRKSRSMVSSIRKPPSVIFTNGTPAQDHRENLQALLPPYQNQHRQRGLQAPKSMSFLRGGRDHLTPRVRENYDIAVQVARDRFLHQVEQQRLREQPSLLFRSNTRKQEKSFGQSLRNSSTNSYGIPIASAKQVSDELNEGRSLRYKARKASKTIKNKLRSLFGRGDAEADETIIPAQQVESQKPYGATFAGSATTLHGSYVDIPHPGNASVSRVTSRVPSLHAVPSSQQLRSRTGSLQSLKSQGSGKSRVTSWTSSVVDHTATSRHAQAERELQRLSIIQENGTHVSSASFCRPSLGNQFSAYPSFHRPRSSTCRLPPIPSPVDSQKVYSALMQRLEESSPEAKLSVRRMASVTSFQSPTPIPPRSSSHNSHQGQTPATIRQVAENSPECVPYIVQFKQEILTTCPHDKDDVFSPKTSSNSSRSVKHRRQQSHSNASVMVASIPRKPSHNAFPLSEVDNEPFVTPQVMADHNEGLPSKRGLTESRSTFFGHTGFTINRTTSPYRRALAEADYNPIMSTGGIPVRASPLGTIPVVVTSSDVRKDSGAQGTPNIAYTESIYSRTTSGQTPPFVESTATLILVQEDDVVPGNTGSVVIVERATYRPTLPTHRPAQSSTDLRVWMAAQVATIEKQRDNVESTAINYTLPSMPKSFGHHVRERAQISADEVEIDQRKVSLPKLPLKLVHQVHAQLSDQKVENTGRKASLTRQTFGTDQQDVHTQIADEDVENALRKVSQLKQPLAVVQLNIPQTNQHTNRKPTPEKKSISPLIEIPSPPPPPPLPPMRPRSPLRVTPSRGSVCSVRTMNSERTGSAPVSATKLTKSQPMQIRPAKTIHSDTAAKLVRGNAQAGTYTPSPTVRAAVNKHFGSANARTPRTLSTGSRTPYSTPYGGTENQAPPSGGISRGEQYEPDVAGLTGPELDAQAMGSRRMVDLFLSSRRRRMAGSDESNAFL